jgi:beta-glucosidase
VRNTHRRCFIFPLRQNHLLSNHQILDGDGEERTVESEEDKELMQKVAAESIVLLKNDAGLLPLKPEQLRKVAIVGGNAKAAILSGGGSAALKPSYYISSYQGIVNALPKNVEVSYSDGATGTCLD